MRRGFPAVAVWLCSLAVSLCALPALAQDFTSDALRPGSWSFQFEIQDDFQLGSFEGGVISATHFSSERSAWRYGLSFAGTTQDADENRTAFSDTSTGTPAGDTDREQDVLSVGLNLTRIFYPERNGRVRPFVGLGPQVGYGHVSSENEFTYPTPGFVSTNELHSTSWSVGARGVLGVEVFAARRISILAQYSTSVNYQRTHETRTVTDTTPGGPPGTLVRGQENETTNHAWRLGENAVSFGVSAYF